MTLGFEFVEENVPTLEVHEYVFPVTGDAPIFTEVPLQIVDGIGDTTVAEGNGFSLIDNNIPVVVAVPALKVPPREYLILKSTVLGFETIGNEIPKKVLKDGLVADEVEARVV